MTYELKVVFFSMLTPGLTYANSQGAKFENGLGTIVQPEKV